MYLKMGRKIINSDNITDADVYEPGADLSRCGEGRAEERTVVITTTATETADDGTLGPRRL